MKTNPSNPNPISSPYFPYSQSSQSQIPPFLQSRTANAHKPPKPQRSKNKKSINLSLKNYKQSHSTSALPNQYNETTIGKEQKNKYLKKFTDTINESDNASEIILGTVQPNHQEKSRQPDQVMQNHSTSKNSQQLGKSHRTSILDQLLTPHIIKQLSKPTSYLRQTTDPTSSPPKIRNKAPSCFEKGSSSGIVIEASQSLGKSKKQIIGSPKFLDGKTSSNKNNEKEKKKFFRQTLDSKNQVNFGPMNLPFSTNKSDFEHSNSKKWLNNKKLTQPNKKVESEKKMGGSFWKNRAVSPPSKSPINKQTEPINEMNIPRLELNFSKQESSKPKFFMSKKSLNKFITLKQIGSGVLRDTFVCLDKKTYAIFCLKRYPKKTFKNSPSLITEFIKRLSFQLLAEHPNIIQLYDIFSDGEFVYTVQEFMEGGKLSQLLTKHQPIQQQVNDLTLQSKPIIPQYRQQKIIDKIFDIIQALSHTHTNFQTPFPHGNIKITKILLNFNTCKIPTIKALHSHNIVNEFNSPQEIVQQKYFPESDVWNLGLVMFELCSGKSLFQHENNEKVSKPAYQVFNINIPEQVQKLNNTQILKQLLKKILSIQPQDRPTMNSLIQSHIFKMYGLSEDQSPLKQQQQVQQRFEQQKQKVSESKFKQESGKIRIGNKNSSTLSEEFIQQRKSESLKLVSKEKEKKIHWTAKIQHQG